MGMGMALNAHKAGLQVTACDLRPEARAAFEEAGGQSVASIDEILTSGCDAIALCLASAPTIKLSEAVLLPKLPQGAVVLDHGTLPVPETRRLHQAFAERGIQHMDVTISGGRGAAEEGSLFLYIGSTEEQVAPWKPYFEAIANMETVYYAGAPGQGQVMKAVQNMASWYLDTIRMEIIAFGFHSGLTPTQIRQATKEEHQPAGFSRALSLLERKVHHFEVGLNAEFEYFLEEADANCFPMPAMRGLIEYLRREERDTIDVVNRPAYHQWKRFMRDGQATDDPFARE